MPDPVTWFDEFGSCVTCSKPANGILRGPGNASYGRYCRKCADARLKKAQRERDIETRQQTRGNVSMLG